MSTTEHFEGFSIIRNGIEIRVGFLKLKKNIERAQYELDGDVMNSMVPFMPMVTGMFVDATRIASAAVQGSGKVYAAYGPQGRFLYEGKGMVDELTGSPWARAGAKKVLVSQYQGKTNASEYLTYNHNAHPRAQSHWFDAAKAADGDMWIRKAQRRLGGK